MKLRVPYSFGKFLSSCTVGGFSRRAQLHDDDDCYDLRVTIDWVWIGEWIY
jgi:hypothetical protein